MAPPVKNWRLLEQSFITCVPLLIETRHSASTSVRVTTPPQYGRNGTAHAAGTSMLSLATGVFAGMRSACGRPGGLPLGSATHY